MIRKKTRPKKSTQKKAQVQDKKHSLGFGGRFWDFCVWLTVLFPLFGGGFWIKRPGLFIELVELAIPVAITSVWGGLLLWGFHRPLEQASSVRFLTDLWLRWEKALRSHFIRSLWIAALLMGFLFALSSLRRHWAFGSGAADLGIFTNAIWNLVFRGEYISSVKGGMNLFADHQSPIFWLFSPLFWLYPHAETLLILQAFLLAAGGVAIACLTRQTLKDQTQKDFHWIVGAAPLLYWAYLPIRNANAFDFHPETTLLPLFLWAIYFIHQAAIRWEQNKKPRNSLLPLSIGLLFFVLALGCKESAPPVAAGICLAWMIGAGPRSSALRGLSVVLLVVSVGVFLFDTKVVPQWFGSQYVYQDQYDQWGKGLFSLLLAPILKADRFWPHVLGPARLKFLFWCIAPLAFLPLLHPRAAIAALPGFLMLFMGQGDHRVSPIYHYGIEPAVGLFFALPVAMVGVFVTRSLNFPRPFKNSLRGLLPRHFAVFFLIFWAGITFGRSELFRIRFFKTTDHHHWLHDEVLPCLKPRESVSVSGAMVPHLANRPWVHHLPMLNMNQWLPNQNPSGQVTCIVKNPEVNNWPMGEAEEHQLKERMKKVGYALEYSCGSFEVYRQNAAQGSCMQCIPSCSL